MNFYSDNCSGLLPEVAAALTSVNVGDAAAYGADPVSQALDELFAAYFDHDVTVLAAMTGTAANCMALASLCGSDQILLCHEASHVHRRESGAAEFFTRGAKLVPVAGADGKIDAAHLERVLAEITGPSGHTQTPVALTLAQPTERGTLYTLEELQAVCRVAHAHGLRVHVDGARFGQAVEALGCAPADLSWRAGVDVVSLGGTKLGGMAAEAMVFFAKPDLPRLKALQKRAGQTVSKMRFLSSQWAPLLGGGMARAARQSQQAAQALLAVLSRIDGFALRHPVQINMILASLPNAELDWLAAQGCTFQIHSKGAETSVARFVTSFSTSLEEIEGLGRLLAAR